MPSRSCFSVTVISHFEIVDEEYIKEVNDKQKWKRVLEGRFQKVGKINERNFQANLEEQEDDILNQTLSQFYTFRNSIIFASIYY